MEGIGLHEIGSRAWSSSRGDVIHCFHLHYHVLVPSGRQRDELGDSGGRTRSMEEHGGVIPVFRFPQVGQREVFDAGVVEKVDGRVGRHRAVLYDVRGILVVDKDDGLGLLHKLEGDGRVGQSHGAELGDISSPGDAPLVKQIRI